jgi:hypothetical protein
MAHLQQAQFCQIVKYIFPEYFTSSRILDVGSLDVNGNNRYLFTSCDYTGIDVADGPNVDHSCPGSEWKPRIKYDTIISTECFEHDMHWNETLQNICLNLLKSGGLFLFTCATTGRSEHGTRRTTPQDSPLTSAFDGDWSDYYMNLTESDIREAIDLEAIFKMHHFYVNKESCDLYFWGIKKAA